MNEYRLIADTNPVPMPMTIWMMIAQNASRMLAGAAEPRMSLTLRPLR